MNPEEFKRSVAGILITFGCVSIAFMMFFLVWLFIMTAAHAHMHDRADLSEWFRSLRNSQGGQCCDGTPSEAVKIEDPDYEGQPDGSYRVKLYGIWIEVPEGRVIKGPNQYGPALAWPYTNMSGVTEIRCFLPGAQT